MARTHAMEGGGLRDWVARLLRSKPTESMDDQPPDEAEIFAQLAAEIDRQTTLETDVQTGTFQYLNVFQDLRQQRDGWSPRTDNLGLAELERILQNLIDEGYMALTSNNYKQMYCVFTLAHLLVADAVSTGWTGQFGRHTQERLEDLQQKVADLKDAAFGLETQSCSQSIRESMEAITYVRRSARKERMTRVEHPTLVVQAYLHMCVGVLEGIRRAALEDDATKTACLIALLELRAHEWQYAVYAIPSVPSSVRQAVDRFVRNVPDILADWVVYILKHVYASTARASGGGKRHRRTTDDDDDDDDRRLRKAFRHAFDTILDRPATAASSSTSISDSDSDLESPPRVIRQISLDEPPPMSAAAAAAAADNDALENADRALPPPGLTALSANRRSARPLPLPPMRVPAADTRAANNMARASPPRLSDPAPDNASLVSPPRIARQASNWLSPPGSTDRRETPSPTGSSPTVPYHGSPAPAATTRRYESSRYVTPPRTYSYRHRNNGYDTDERGSRETAPFRGRYSAP